MSEKRMKSMLVELTRQIADKGTLIEAGSQVVDIVLKGYPEDTRYTARMSYWLGAHHCFAAMINMMDDTQDLETPEDLQRMSKLNDELERMEPLLKAWVKAKQAKQR